MICIFITAHKNTLSSKSLEDCARQVIAATGEECRVIIISDGGNDFLHAYQQHKDCARRIIKFKSKFVKRKFNIPILTQKSENKLTAVVESSYLLGTHFWGENFDRKTAHSGGLGEFLNELMIIGINHFVIGLGGGVTSDAGLMCLHELGGQILLRDGKNLTPNSFSYEKMKDVVAINARSDAPINNTQIQILSDTSAHFCGETGQAYIFAAQKGFSADETSIFDEGLRQVLNCIVPANGGEIGLEGWGANGGLGGTFVSVLDANLVMGAGYFLDQLGPEFDILNCKPIITEGVFDRSSFNGKITGEIIKMFPPGTVTGIFGLNRCNETEFLEYYELSNNNDEKICRQRLLGNFKKALSKSIGKLSKL